MKMIGKRKFKYDTILNGEYRCSGNYLKTLERDQFTCVLCGSKDFIIVHHLDNKTNNNNSNNLLSVCRHCHADLHGYSIFIKGPKIELIKELKACGKTFQQIGDHLGISRQRVHQIYKKASNLLTP